MKTACDECGKIFNLLNEDQANEFYYGHDCEFEDDGEFKRKEYDDAEFEAKANPYLDRYDDRI